MTRQLKLWFVFFLTLYVHYSLAQHIVNRDSLREVLKTHQQDSSRVLTLASLSFTYAFINADTAIMYGQEALTLVNKLKDKNGTAASMQAYAMALWIYGNYDKAAEFALKSLHLYEELNRFDMIVGCYNLLGNIYRDVGDYALALQFSNEAIRTCNQHNLAVTGENLTPLSAATLPIRATILLSTGHVDSAAYYMHMDDVRNQPPFLRSSSFGVGLMGHIELARGNYDQSRKYFQKALSIALQTQRVDALDIYNGIGDLYLKTGQIDSSIYYGKEVVNKWQYTSYKKAVLFAINRLARCYKLKNINDSTIKYLELGRSLNDSLYSQEKVRSMQNINFNEELQKKDIESARVEYQNEIKFYVLSGIFAIFLLLGGILYRNNRQKQKANRQLQLQKEKVESTLKELKITQAQLIQSEKMASLGELTAGIAHEIQNPLNFVNNFSELNRELLVEMKDEIGKGNVNDVQLLADHIIENQVKINYHGNRADAIVKGMLQHSRVSTGVKEPADINALAEEYLKLAQFGMKAKDKSFSVAIKTDFDLTIGNIPIIPQEIGRVLLNLYNNAFYAVAEKSKQQIDHYRPEVSVKTRKVDGQLVLTVMDNGNGVSEMVINKIFQPFFTTKPTGQGTGLGLSLSYDLIKAHQGTLKVFSKEGEGARFVVEIPFISLS